MRVHDGGIVFASDHNLTRRPTGSAVELFPGQSVAVDYRTAAVDGSSPLATCASPRLTAATSSQGPATLNGCSATTPCTDTRPAHSPTFAEWLLLYQNKGAHDPLDPTLTCRRVDADLQLCMRSCTNWTRQPAVLVHIPYARYARADGCLYRHEQNYTGSLPSLLSNLDPHCRNVFHYLSGVASTLQTLTEQAIVPAAIAR